MKKLNLDFIKKADYILVFLCAAVGLIFLLILIIYTAANTLFSSSSSDVSVSVIETNNQNKELPDNNNNEESTDEELIEFTSMMNDVYVFKVKNPKMREEKVSISMYKGSSRSDDDGLTNFLFINSQKEEYKLFPSNSQYIYSYSNGYDFYDSDSNDYKGKNDTLRFYAVIKADTNNDKYLNSDDDISLYVSGYNGKNLTEISSSIMSCKEIGKHKILFTEFHDGELKYYVFDYKKKEKDLIKSVKQKVKEKSIEIY